MLIQASITSCEELRNWEVQQLYKMWGGAKALLPYRPVLKPDEDIDDFVRRYQEWYQAWSEAYRRDNAS